MAVVSLCFEILNNFFNKQNSNTIF